MHRWHRSQLRCPWEARSEPGFHFPQPAAMPCSQFGVNPPQIFICISSWLFVLEELEYYYFQMFMVCNNSPRFTKYSILRAKGQTCLLRKCFHSRLVFQKMSRGLPAWVLHFTEDKNEIGVNPFSRRWKKDSLFVAENWRGFALICSMRWITSYVL